MVKKYTDILLEELVVATGCTEPIAIVHAVAKAVEILGCMPEEIIIEASPNIIKNAKSVSIPNAEDLKGMSACGALGASIADSTNGLRILEGITPIQVKKAREMLEKGNIRLKALNTSEKVHCIIVCNAQDNNVRLEIKKTHTNISLIEKNGEIIFKQEGNSIGRQEELVESPILNVQDICEFVKEFDVSSVKEIFEIVRKHNEAIAKEGLMNRFGDGIATIINKYHDKDNIYMQIKKVTTAASDARMNGCPSPVVAATGSGNQGLTATLPIIEYAKYKNYTEEELYRALAMSLLITIHQKSKIGRLSAYCGAVTAACGAGCGLTYLEKGADVEAISKTLTNTVATISGMICDGAKTSCAAKIAISLEAAIMGHLMAIEGYCFEGGTGIVKDNVEKTIEAVGELANRGMKTTDQVILQIMLED